MKKLLFILLTLFTLQSFAQTDSVYVKVRNGIPGVYNMSKNAGGDSIVFYVSGVRYALSAGAGKVDYVADISSLENYTGNAKTLIVYDIIRGGIFNFSTTGALDSGTVFNHSSSGYWVRQYNKSSGVNVDWFGSRNDITINLAINSAGTNGIINFTPAQTYTLDNTIYPLSGQILNGNGATLKRDNDTVVVLSSPVLSTDSSFTVNAIPSVWKSTSGVYEFFSDSTGINSNVTTTKSVSIVGNTVKLGGTIGKGWAANTTYVRRSFSMLYAVNQATGIKIYNLTFDGNKANTSSNVSWLANTTILAKGYGDLWIDHCNFINIPNETIMGQGLRITNNNANNLNGSFVHLSTEANTLPVNKPTIITNNFTQNTNLKQAITGHSEGVITNSFSPGYVTITDNRFVNGGTSGVFGYIQSDTDPADGAYKNVIISGNYAENFSKIFYSLSILPSLNRNGHIFIQGNTFNNCGINDWMLLKDSIDKYTDSIMIGNNMLVGGTVWKIPIQKSDSLQRYIINNGTNTSQNAFLNISRSATIGDTLSVGNIPTGNITDSAVVTKNKLVKKVSFNDLGFMPNSGGQFTGDVSFSNNKILYGRLTDFTGVSMLQLDNTNALNYGNMSIPYSYFYTTNDYTFYNNPSVLKRFTIKNNGHILLGNIGDNGTDWLQVGGTINSLGNSIIGKTEVSADSSNNIASTAFVKRESAGKLDSSYRDKWGVIDPVVTDTVNKILYLRQSFVDSMRNLKSIDGTTLYGTGDIKVKNLYDDNNNLALLSFNSTDWKDATPGTKYGMGGANKRVVITAQNGYSVLDRYLISSSNFQFTNGTTDDVPTPVNPYEFIDNTLGTSGGGHPIVSFSETGLIYGTNLIPKVASSTSVTTLTPNFDTASLFTVTALSGSLTILNPTGTYFKDGTPISIRIKDNGTSRTISWDSQYKSTFPLPTTTTPGKTSYFVFTWDAPTSTWFLVNNQRPDVSNRNYDNDSLAIVDGGLKLNDWYRTGNIIKTVVTLPYFIGFNVSTTDSVTVQFQTFSTGSNLGYAIDWGDGSTTNIAATSRFQYPSHKYMSAGTYPIQMSGFTDSTFQAIDFTYGKTLKNVTKLYNLNKFPDITSLILDGSKFTDSTSYAVISQMNSLTDLSLYNCSMSSLQLATISPTVTSINLRNNNFSVTAVNNALVWLDSQTFNAGAKDLDIRQSTSAPPSGAGLTAITSLQSKGWTITHD